MTHKEKVLALLSDGEPHTHMEGYRLGVMLHSRVADLRKEGHVIECWRDGEDYLYQLAGTVQAEESGFISAIGSGLDDGTPLLGPSAAVAVPPIEAGQAGPADLPLEPDRQLSVFEAAA